MPKLSPTLWRTCRILSGKTRLELLRLVIGTTNQTISDLANRLELSMPRASQELRRLQSRGLIQASRDGMSVLYHPTPDPLVSTASPLLQAIKETFLLFPSSEDDSTIRTAMAFSHTRRLLILRLLQIGPMDTQTLEDLSGMSRDALNRHLKKMLTAHLICRKGKQIHLDENNSHPLVQALFRILKESPPPVSE